MKSLLVRVVVLALVGAVRVVRSVARDIEAVSEALASMAPAVPNGRTTNAAPALSVATSTSVSRPSRSTQAVFGCRRMSASSACAAFSRCFKQRYGVPPSAFDLEARYHGTTYRGDAAGIGNPHLVLFVDDDELAMVTKVNRPTAAQWIYGQKRGEPPPGTGQSREPLRVESERADRVVEQADRDPLRCLGGEDVEKSMAGLVVPDDVIFGPD